MLQEPDQPRGRKDCWHVPVREVDHVSGFDNEPLFACRTDFGVGLHRCSLPCATRLVQPVASHRLSPTAGEHKSPHASCREVPAKRNPSRAVAAETPALTAETMPTRAFSISSLMPASRAFSIRPNPLTAGVLSRPQRPDSRNVHKRAAQLPPCSPRAARKGDPGPAGAGFHPTPAGYGQSPRANGLPSIFFHCFFCASLRIASILPSCSRRIFMILGPISCGLPPDWASLMRGSIFFCIS